MTAPLLVPVARRIHWWFVVTSAVIILFGLGLIAGVVLFAYRTNDHDGLIGMMLFVISTMMLYPLMPVYAEIVQDRRRRHDGH